jgi:hypothetical protein
VVTVIAVVALVSVSITSLFSTLFVIIMLNGYPSLPDDMVLLYAGCAFGIGPALALIISGLASKKINKISPIPTWLAGIGLVILANISAPFILVGYTFVLLAAFGMLY